MGGHAICIQMMHTYLCSLVSTFEANWPAVRNFSIITEMGLSRQATWRLCGARLALCKPSKMFVAGILCSIGSFFQESLVWHAKNTVLHLIDVRNNVANTQSVNNRNISVSTKKYFASVICCPALQAGGDCIRGRQDHLDIGFWITSS